MSGAEVADFVDLTDSPAPEQPAKNPAKANKRSREDTEVIDVVSREDIMSFAAKANQRKRLTSPLSDSTGQVENARQEGPGRPDNLWLKQLHAERTARHGEPNSNDEATADHPDNFPAYSSEAGPSGRGDVSAPAEDCQQRNISLLTWNVWCVRQSDPAMHQILVTFFPGRILLAWQLEVLLIHEVNQCLLPACTISKFIWLHLPAQDM